MIPRTTPRVHGADEQTAVAVDLMRWVQLAEHVLRGERAPDDAEMALTLEFADGRLVLHDGIKGVPDVAVRGSSDAIMTMSNIPLTKPLGLPIPLDRGGLDVLREMARMTRTKEVQIFGMFGNFGILSRLTRVMSVNG